MDSPDYSEQRSELLQSIEHDEDDVRVAVRELTGAARFQFDIAAHIKRHPMKWLMGGLLLGMWMGGGLSPRVDAPNLHRRQS